MNKFLWGLAATVLISTWAFAAETQQKDRARLDQIEQSLKSDVPRVLCLDSNFATGGQPTEQAYAKAAASGFHSVLSLRAAGEGIDLTKERALSRKNRAPLLQYSCGIQRAARRTGGRVHSIGQRKIQPPDAH